MHTLVRLLGGLIAVLILGIAALLIGARFSDGPLAIIAGGAFTSGQLVTDPVSDWSFLHDTQEVEFQLLDPVRSRTTWIIEHDSYIFTRDDSLNANRGQRAVLWVTADLGRMAVFRLQPPEFPYS